MIPRVAQAGRSFKGAALYYLHDKKANTSDRVAWSQTLNLPTDDPNRAVAHMIDTAAHADRLKLAAGLKAGRKLQKPVYVYSLAWHPDQAPSQAEQLEAARETISVLGLTSHQALIVSHNDTEHPHVHVIVNRVDPETGKAAVMSNDQLKLSQWAQDYERRHGQILCEARVQNNAERDKGAWVKHTPETRQERMAWKKAETAKLWKEFRAEKEAAYKTRKPQYDALWQQRQNRLKARKAELKVYHKPLWRDLFKRQRLELQNFDVSLLKRIAFAMANPTGNSFGILAAITNSGALRGQMVKQQQAERAQLSAVQKLRIQDASREVHKAWQYDRDQLRAMHKAEDDQRHTATQEAVRAVWDDQGANTPANEQEATQTPEIASQRDRVKRSRSRTRQKFADVIRETTPREEIERAQQEVRDEAAKKRRRERDTGRKFTPD